MTEINHGKIIPVSIENEMKTSYIDYAMSVIVMRALPDVRDGLKPVHRRILFAMHEAGVLPNKPYVKSSRVVGEVLGKFHPHGDSSVYDAMVRLAQDFSTRYLMVDGHGNFGSVDGDSAAAMRYTEVRLSKLAEEMLANIEKDTVDFMPNYDGKEQEPVVLPAKIPNLLVNGAAGIAVGMATNIPPHNLGEVIDGVVMLIDNPEAQVQDLMTVVKGPDFPTGALILGREGIRNAYMTGKGSVKMRAVAKIERMSNGKSRILVTEIPYQVNKARLVESIADLVREKTIDGITDLRDESDRTGMRIVIELRRDVNPDVILNQLYKHTHMQESFGVNMLALVDGHPKVLNLRQALYYYLEHQKEVITRRTEFELRKARDRAHILEGLRIALDHIDAVITTIRESRTVDIAREALVENFSLSEKQAQAILDMRLQRLTGLEREKIEEEFQELLKLIAKLSEILADEKKIYAIIREELLDIKKRYADERRTMITSDVTKLEMEDLIAEEDIVITLTHYGYIKRLPMDTYKNQKRGGRGVTGMQTKEEDFVEHLFVATTHHNILFFTNKGKVYRVKGYEIPEASRQAKGIAMVNLVPLEAGEKVNAVIPVKEFNAELYLVLATRGGIIKKTDLSEYDTVRKGGLIALTLDERDELIGVKLTDGQEDIFLGTKNGLAIRFHEGDVRSMGRTARGVKGINLRETDEVVGMVVVRDNAELLVVTENGHGKRTPFTEFRPQTRGGIGVKMINLSRINTAVAGLKTVISGSEVMLITIEGIVIRMSVDDISVQGRSAQGVTLMRLDEGDKVGAVAFVFRREDEE